MKRLLDELKEQLSQLKDKIETINSKIDESETEIVIIEKDDFKLFEITLDGGYTFFKFKECQFRVDNIPSISKSFKEGKLEYMVIKKMKSNQTWCYGRIILTHALLNDLEAAKHKFY